MEKFYTPFAILVAGAVIGGAVLYSDGASSGFKGAAIGGAGGNNQITPERERALIDPRRSENRNLKGAPDAKITIVEFSDFECPYCSRVHPTLEQIVEDFPGEVNWEFRHLPLVNHPNARPAAIASECVAELGGDDAFWDFTDFLFANQRSLRDATFASGAKSLGINPGEFSECLSREDIAERVIEDERTAAVLGGSGTPYNVIVYEDGSTRAVPGALPYNQFKSLIQR